MAHRLYFCFGKFESKNKKSRDIKRSVRVRSLSNLSRNRGRGLNIGSRKKEMIRMTFKNAEKNSHIYSGGRQVGGCMRLEETVCVAPIKRNIKIKYV